MFAEVSVAVTQVRGARIAVVAFTVFETAFRDNLADTARPLALVARSAGIAVVAGTCHGQKRASIEEVAAPRGARIVVVAEKVGRGMLAAQLGVACVECTIDTIVAGFLVEEPITIVVFAVTDFLARELTFVFAPIAGVTVEIPEALRAEFGDTASGLAGSDLGRGQHLADDTALPAVERVVLVIRAAGAARGQAAAGAGSQAVTVDTDLPRQARVVTLTAMEWIRGTVHFAPVGESAVAGEEAGQALDVLALPLDAFARRIDRRALGAEEHIGESPGIDGRIAQPTPVLRVVGPVLDALLRHHAPAGRHGRGQAGTVAQTGILGAVQPITTIVG